MKHMATYDGAIVYLIALDRETRQTAIIIEPEDLHEDERAWVDGIITDPKVQMYDWLWKIAQSISHPRGFNAFDFMVSKGRRVPLFGVGFADENQCKAWIGSSDQYSTRAANSANNYFKDFKRLEESVVPPPPSAPVDTSNVLESTPITAEPTLIQIPEEQRQALEAMKAEAARRQAELDELAEKKTSLLAETNEAQSIQAAAAATKIAEQPGPATTNVARAEDVEKFAEKIESQANQIEELKSVLIGIQKSIKNMELRWDDTGKTIKRISKELNKHGVPTKEHVPPAKRNG